MSDLTDIDTRWMLRALELANKAESLGEVPVGAVVIRDDQLIGQGYNCPISTNDPTAHAEIVAIRAASCALDNYRLTGCTLYVTIEPCVMCAGALINSRIERLVYGATEPRAGAVASQLQIFDQIFFNHKVKWRGGVMSSVCGNKLTEFFQAKRKSSH